MEDSKFVGNKYGRLRVTKDLGVCGKNRTLQAVCDCGTFVERTVQGMTGSNSSCGCARRDDLTGLTFGRLTVREFVRVDEKSRRALWLCDCSCSKTHIVNSKALKSGNTTSCGCRKREGLRQKDHTGAIFGMLTVLERSKRVNGKSWWWVQCECGNVVDRGGNSMQRGHTKSCGCLGPGEKRDQEKENQKWIGQVFNRWTITAFNSLDKHGSPTWNCVCKCGNKGTVVQGDLRQNKSKSCGCWNDEQIRIKGRPERAMPKGPASARWRDDYTEDEREVMRKGRRGKYRWWADRIKEHFGHKCDTCGSDEELRAHHLWSATDYVDFSLELGNGVCLCKICHDEFHYIYTYNNFTPADYLEYRSETDFYVVPEDDQRPYS